VRALKIVSILLFFVFAVFLFTNTVFAVTNNFEKIQDLKQKIEELEREADKYRDLIEQKQGEADSLKKELEILNSQIYRLRIKISITSKQIETAELELEDLRNQIDDTKSIIEENKLVISGILRNIYDFDKQNFLAILLNNQRFSGFFSQVQNLNNLQNSLLLNIEKLRNLKRELEDQKITTEGKKQELENLNSKYFSQKRNLDGIKLTKNNLLRKTKGQEKEYKSFLNRVEEQKAKLYKELRQLELETIKNEVYIVRVKAKSIPPPGIKLFKMPYDDFYISQGYGMTRFAKRGAYGGAPHNGIDLVAGFGSEIKSIGSGVVLARGFNNLAGNWIAIKHDNDLVSIYGHMKDPTMLSVGERINENTVIGYEGTTGFVTGSHLHLSLYYEFFTFIGPKTGQVYFNYFKGSLNPLDYLDYR